MDNASIKILLIENDLKYTHLIRDALATRPNIPENLTFELKHADWLVTGLTHLSHGIFDIILLDLSLPDSRGIETLTKVQTMAPNIPIIVLIQSHDQAAATQAMEKGAETCLVKSDLDKGTIICTIEHVLKQRQLREELAEKTAELQSRNAELDTFAHTIAHQVKGSLSQIIGYTEYAQSTYGNELEEELCTILERILQSGHKINNIMSEVSLLASVRSHDQVNGNPLEMDRVVSEACKRLRLQINESQGKITIPETWPVAKGHGPWIEEVWVNYISNGLKYGGQPPHLKLGATPLADGMIRFWIKDNGTGISAADQSRLFTPYTRLLHQHRVRGEGLGLSIVRRIIEKSGGSVGVESKVGAGSTFWFTLPAYTAPETNSE